MLTWSPKEGGCIQSERPTVYARVCHARLPWDCEVIQRQHCCHHGDAICLPKSGYVTTKLHGTSTSGCNNNAICSDRAIFTFPTVGVRRPCYSGGGKLQSHRIVRSVARCDDWSCERSLPTTIDHTIGLRVPRLIVERAYARSLDATSARTMRRRMQRSIDRTIGRRPSRLIVHRSLISTISRTISYDGSCHRYSPIVRDNATTRTDRSRYATAAGDRSKHCRSVAPGPNRNQSYDPEIVRMGRMGMAFQIAECVSSTHLSRIMIIREEKLEKENSLWRPLMGKAERRRRSHCVAADLVLITERNG